MNDLSLTALRHFYYVAKLQGFSRAARHLKVRQPSISKMVAQLEADLGARLFVRTTRTLALTEVGKSVYRECESMADALANISSISDTQSNHIAGEVKIGTTDAIAKYLLVPLLVDLMREHPLVVPRIIVAPGHQIVADLQQGSLEVGLGFTFPINGSIDRRAIAKIPHRVVVATSHLQNEQVLTAFIGSRELDDEATRSFPTVSHLQKTRPRTHIAISSNSIETHKSLVMQGGGIAILPEFMIKEELKQKSLSIASRNYRFVAELVMIQKKGRHYTRATSEFVQRLLRRLRAVRTQR